MFSRVKTNKAILGWVVCVLAAIFFCYEYFLRITPSVMVEELMSTFRVSATKLGMLSAFFYFTYTPMQLIVGILLDLYGSRKILTLAVATCTLGSYIFGATDSLVVAAFGRALIGFGSAFAFVCVLKLAHLWLPRRFFAFFVGLTTMLGMFGAMFQVTIFSGMVKEIGWRYTIDLGTIFGVFLLPLVWLVIRDKPAGGEDDALRLPVRYQDVFRDLLKLVSHPQLWLSGTIACLMYLSLSLFAELWGIPFLTSVYQLTPGNAASACAMVYLGWLVGSPLVGYFSDITRSRRILLVVGCLLSFVTISLIVYFPIFDLILLKWLLFLFGVFTSAEILCFAVSCEHSPKPLVATATAFTNFITMLGAVVAQPLIGKLLDIFWSGDYLGVIRNYSAANYQLAMSILPVAMLIGLALSFFIKENGNKK